MQHARFLSLLPALALVLANGAANAVELSSDAAGFTFSPYRYAKETLPKAGSFAGTGDDASTTYYVVTEDPGVGRALDLQFDAGLSASASDTVLLHVTLTGMAFHDTVSAYHTDSADPSVNFSLVSGGQKGDTTAILRYTGNGITDNPDANDSEDRVTIDIGSGDKLGISAGQVGGVEVALVNVTLEEILGTGKARTTVTQPRAVVGVPGFVRKVTPTTPTPTARVRHGFEAFDDAGAHRAALLTRLTLILPTPAPQMADGQPLAFETALFSFQQSRARLLGDLSFAEQVRVVPAGAATRATCGTEGFSWPIATDGTMTEWLVMIPPGQSERIFGPDTQPGNTTYVCIEAKADTAIPAASFRIELDYGSGPGWSFDDFVSPTADEIVDIGSIRRDGTTIHLPYVSTHEKYNQRFLIVNNGPDAAYEFTFTPESGVDAEPGAAASGTLAKGTTHLKASEVVTLTGGNRTAATFSAAAVPGNIEMSSVLVSRTKGETDLSVLQAEE